MRVLALASQKGGSGKTTLSGHLAVQAQRAGAGPVVLIDIDPQGSLADWWNEREADFPAFAQTTVGRLAQDLQVLRQQGFKLAVIDTPPAITMAIQSVIALSELIVVPTRPSPHDLRAVGATVDLCERAGKPLIFAVNGATPKARITAEAIVALSQHGTVAPITLHHRTDFAASMIDGRTVMEVDPTGRSAAEVAQLWSYISERLEKNFRRTVFAVPQQSQPGMAPVRALGGAAQRRSGRQVRRPEDAVQLRLVEHRPDDAPVVRAGVDNQHGQVGEGRRYMHGADSKLAHSTRLWRPAESQSGFGLGTPLKSRGADARLHLQPDPKAAPVPAAHHDRRRCFRRLQFLAGRPGYDRRKRLCRLRLRHHTGRQPGCACFGAGPAG